MESIVIVLAGVLVMIATYLFLSRNLIRIILGSSLLSHAAHLLLMSMGGLKKGRSPLIREAAESYVDALQQALILKAIITKYAVTAIFLVVAKRTYQKSTTDNLDVLRGLKDE